MSASIFGCGKINPIILVHEIYTDKLNKTGASGKTAHVLKTEICQLPNCQLSTFI
jgi:hypothetical protein